MAPCCCDKSLGAAHLTNCEIHVILFLLPQAVKHTLRVCIQQKSSCGVIYETYKMSDHVYNQINCSHKQ